MWVKFSETYIGKLGSFPAGTEIDLSDGVLKQLSKVAKYKPCPPPWDRKKDTKGIKQAELKANAKDAQAWSEIVQAKADAAKQKAAEAGAAALQRQGQLDEAEKAVEAANKAHIEKRSEKSVKVLAGLVCQAQAKSYQHQRAAGELMIALADAGLLRLEAESAKRRAEEKSAAAGFVDVASPQGDRSVAQGQTVPAAEAQQ